MECQAIENERAIRLVARHREVGKQAHIVTKPCRLQRGNENLLLQKGSAEKNDTCIGCRDQRRKPLISPQRQTIALQQRNRRSQCCR